MPVSKIKSREDFGKYCLRKLGDPVLKVNVTKDQVDDCIDDALHMFYEYHADGSTQMFFKHKLTQQEIDDRQVEIPTNVLSVIRVLPPGGSSGIANKNNLQYQMFFSNLLSSIPFGGLSSFFVSMEKLATIQATFDPEKLFEYNKHHHTIIFQGTIKPNVGDYIVYEAVVTNDPEINPLTWNNWWLKNYTTSLIKKQWGVNLGKYQSVTLPGGVTLNGEQIRAEGIQEIESLEERLRDEFQLPLEMHIG